MSTTTPLVAKTYRLRRGAPLLGSSFPEPRAAAPQAAAAPAGGAEAPVPLQRLQAVAPQAGGAAAAPGPQGFFGGPEETDDGFGSTTFATAGAATPPEPAPPDEELTARKIRLLRRNAERHKIVAESDHEALRKMRELGIDPFRRSVALEPAATDATGAAATSEPSVPATAGGKLPVRAETAKMPVAMPAPSAPARPPAPVMLSEAERALAIMKVQRDLAKRRRRKVALLFTRLAFFVLLPTILCGYYFYAVATPLYATKTEFLIKQADSAGIGGAGMGGLLSGGGGLLGAAQDSMTVQSYLQSREAMIRLDKEVGFRSAYAGDTVDPITRISPTATNEEVYRLYLRNVKIGFDPTEGIVKMEVSAPDPQTSVKFSQALLGYAEEQVDQLTKRLRTDQMAGAEESVVDAEKKVEEAQMKVQRLQEEVGILDPKSEGTSILSQISKLEAEQIKKQLELTALKDNPQPNQARVRGVEKDLGLIGDQIASLRASLTESGGAKESLAVSTGQLRIAEADLETRLLMFSQAMQHREAARIEANKQVRYITAGVRPVAPDEATYPRAFENTLLSFFVFAGIYLFLSLTAAILREQMLA